mgnify:CR=1 FL=1
MTSTVILCTLCGISSMVPLAKCAKCGGKNMRVCMDCGNHNSLAKNYCDNCGKQIAETTPIAIPPAKIKVMEAEPGISNDPWATVPLPNSRSRRSRRKPRSGNIFCAAP